MARATVNSGLVYIHLRQGQVQKRTATANQPSSASTKIKFKGVLLLYTVGVCLFLLSKGDKDEYFQ